MDDATTCPACRTEKGRHEAVCARCYEKLPYGMRMALYRRSGPALTNAINSAVDFLEARKTHAGAN